MTDTTEPTNEALIVAAFELAAEYQAAKPENESAAFKARNVAIEAIRTRLAALTERAEKAEAERDAERDLCSQRTGLWVDAKAELARTREVVDAARCIRHWHDTHNGGMIVSGSHVFALWDALDKYDAALAKPEPADGSPESQAVNWICPVHKTCSTPGECQKNDSCMAAPQEMK